MKINTQTLIVSVAAGLITLAGCASSKSADCCDMSTCKMTKAQPLPPSNRRSNPPKKPQAY